MADICAAVMRLGQRRLCHIGPSMSACVRERMEEVKKEKERTKLRKMSRKKQHGIYGEMLRVCGAVIKIKR